MVALSFASDAEANVFFKTATATVSNRSKRRRSKKFSPTRSVDNGYNGSIAPQKPSGKFIQIVHTQLGARNNLQNSSRKRLY